MLAINHQQAESHIWQGIFFHVILVRIIVPWKHNTVWNKVSANIKKKIDRKPVYNKKFLKTEMKSYGNKVTDF